MRLSDHQMVIFPEKYILIIKYQITFSYTSSYLGYRSWKPLLHSVLLHLTHRTGTHRASSTPHRTCLLPPIVSFERYNRLLWWQIINQRQVDRCVPNCTYFSCGILVLPTPPVCNPGLMLLRLPCILFNHSLLDRTWRFLCLSLLWRNLYEVSVLSQEHSRWLFELSSTCQILVNSFRDLVG